MNEPMTFGINLINHQLVLLPNQLVGQIVDSQNNTNGSINHYDYNSSGAKGRLVDR